MFLQSTSKLGIDRRNKRGLDKNTAVPCHSSTCTCTSPHIHACAHIHTQRHLRFFLYAAIQAAACQNTDKRLTTKGLLKSFNARHMHLLLHGMQIPHLWLRQSTLRLLRGFCPSSSGWLLLRWKALKLAAREFKARSLQWVAFICVASYKQKPKGGSSRHVL